MSLEDHVDNPLWPVLVETVHAMIMYSNHKAYTRDVVVQEHPEMTPQELAIKLNIPFGEGLVILHELHREKGKSK